MESIRITVILGANESISIGKYRIINFDVILCFDRKNIFPLDHEILKKFIAKNIMNQ